jgi:hypothetical protein
MSNLLDLLYEEYTRSRMAAIDVANDFAQVWKLAHHRRSVEIGRQIAAALETAKSPSSESPVDRRPANASKRLAISEGPTFR